MADQNTKTPEQEPDKKIKPETNAHEPVEEQGGVDRLEPTRYGDWEKAGRCIDF